MVLGAVTVFFASLASILGLFSFKLWEERKGRSLLPTFRSTTDAFALKCKNLLIRAEESFARIPSLTMYVAMTLLASGAVAFARLARGAAEAAHGLADFVSHKHNFERRETRSDFLKKVGEHQAKNQNGSSDPIRADVVSSSFDGAEVPAPQSVKKIRKAARDVDMRT